MARPFFSLCILVLCLAVAGCEDSCPTCVETTQVRGFVRDANGIGIEGTTVHVLGKPPVLTTADGSFFFDGVATPYDLVYEGAANDPIRVWRGMTQRDPVILGYTNVFAGVDTARVTGSAPADPGRTTVVFFMAPGVLTGSRADIAGMQYSMRLGWLADGQPRTGRMFLLRFRQDPSTMQFLEFDGFATQPLEAYPGGVYRVDLASVEDPLDRSIAGTVAVPAGYEAISAQLWMEAEQHAAPLGYRLVEGGEFAFVAPTLPDVTYRVAVDSRITIDGSFRRSFTAKGGLQSWDRADLVVRAAPEPLVPQQDQVIGRTTPFSWRDDGTPVLHIIHVHSTRRYVIYVVGTETRLDDLPGPGIESGSWAIYRIDGQNAVDPSFRDSPRESFATSELVRFRVASELVHQP